MSSRHPKPPQTAQEALAERMEVWADVTTTERDDHDRRAINSTSLIIGRKVSDRLGMGLMSRKFPQAWTDPILDFIENAAKQLYEAGGNADDINGNHIAEIAALRFETLELEERIRLLERQMAKL